MKKIATIYADASFCNKTNVFGWTFWAVFDNVRIKEKGNGLIDTTEHAELFALMKGFQYIMKQWPEVNMIIFVSDCKGALRLLWPWTALDKRKKAKEILEVHGFLSSEIKSRTKHVKGHQGGRNKQSYVNEWCDKNAYWQMRHLREKVSQKINE